MKSALTVAALVFAVVLVQGYARTASLTETAHVGTVEALYAESHPGVYVPLRTSDSRSTAAVWVHIRFAHALEDGRRFAVAALPAGLQVAPGDVVEMRFGGLAAAAGTQPRHDRVTALIAQKHTAQAAVR
jgi:hypothetical protein